MMKNINNFKTKTMKKYLKNNYVFLTERETNGNMKVSVILNEKVTYLCTLLNTSLNYSDGKTMDYLDNLYKNYLNNPLYIEEEANIEALLSIGAYISPKKKEELGFAPSYFVEYTQYSTNPMLSYNGGDYSYWKVYFPIENSESEYKYAVQYCTSCDIEGYCPRCGRWSGNGCNCEQQYARQLPFGAVAVWR